MVLSETGLISSNQCSILVQVEDYVQIHVHVLQEILLNFVPFVTVPTVPPAVTASYAGREASLFQMELWTPAVFPVFDGFPCPVDLLRLKNGKMEMRRRLRVRWRALSFLWFY